MTYKVIITDSAEDDIYRLRKSGEIRALKKLDSLLSELKNHPETGTGHPEPLKGDRAGQWSRRITQKHRLVYKIEEEQIIVLVLSAYGHYDD